MVFISENLVKKILEDVAPKVERLTGWDTYLEDLNIAIINRDQFWEYAIKPKYDSLGISTIPNTDKGKKSLKQLKKFFPYLAIGLYEDKSNTLFLVPDNLRFGTNESGLSTLLGHELVHRCQFTNNPKFLGTYNNLVKRLCGTNAFDENDLKDETANPIIEAYMTLVEGDATFVQEQLNEMFYQNSKKKGALMSMAASLFYLAFLDKDKELWRKFKQYGKGKEVVSRLYNYEGRKCINELYHADEKRIRSKFGY